MDYVYLLYNKEASWNQWKKAANFCRMTNKDGCNWGCVLRNTKMIVFLLIIISFLLLFISPFIITSRL